MWSLQHCLQRYTLLNLIDKLNNTLETDVRPVFVEPKRVEVKHSMTDLSKARNKLGYQLKYDFNQV